MKIDNLDDLFLHALKHMVCAEREIFRTQPKMEHRETDPKLKADLVSHRGETEAHVPRLEEVFDTLNKPARSAGCDPIVGFAQEAKDMMADIEAPETMDAGLISFAQAARHYEIARYRTLLVWVTQLGCPKAAAFLKETMAEEHGADNTLSKMAARRLNVAALA